jgi:epidermal growth factor receptor substrate 15
MASEASVDAGAPNLNLTPEEKRAYGQLFRQADTDNVGVVTGEVAVKFFEKTRLDSRVLGEVSLDNMHTSGWSGVCLRDTQD